MSNINNKKKTENDYRTSDGLLRCGKCHEPKERNIDVCGEIKTLKVECKCERERREKCEIEMKKEKEEAKRRKLKKLVAKMKEEKHKSWIKIILLYDEMENFIFENDDGNNRELTKKAKKYVDKFEKNNNGLLFYGPVGSGKTFMAVCIANALYKKEYKCLVINFSKIKNIYFRAQDKQEVLAELNNFDLIVIDDMFAESSSEYTQEIVFAVIDIIYNNKIPLIVTTNLTKEELQNPKDLSQQRVFSRLLEWCVPIEVKGEDRRGKKALENYKKFTNTLEE